MAGGQKKTGSILRSDLMDMLEELSFEQLNLVADKIAPVAGVSKRSAAYPVLPREVRGKIPDTRRAKKGGFARGEWNYDEDTYISREYGYEEFVDETEALEVGEWIDLEKDAGELAVQGLLKAREARVASVFMNESIWTGANNIVTLGSADHAWRGKNSTAKVYDYIDTAAQLIRAKAFLGKASLTLAVTDDILNSVMRSAEVTSDTKYTLNLLTLPVEAKKQWLASYLGIGSVEVVSNLFDSAGLGQSAVASRYWNNNYGFLGYVGKGGKTTLKSQLAVKQINWDVYSKDYYIESYEDESRKGRVIRAVEYRGEKVNTDFGVMIKGLDPTADAVTGM